MGRFASAVVAILFFALPGASAVWGQLPSVVQLPSFQTFSYSGSVLVPDGGTTSLGGVSRSAMSSQRRPFSRSFGWSQSNAQAAVSATIIDLNEMDRQILGASPKEFVREGKVASSRQADPVEEGKSLVRYARKQFLEGKESESFVTYQMAIGVLDGRLQELAVAEFRRVFGTAAEQSLRLAQRP
jgi:hypothetical protein